MILLVTGSDGRWQPGIGDPTLMGWFTVFAYAYAALVCYQTSRALRHSGRSARSQLLLGDTLLALCWVGLALLLAALGVNKQLDLQSLLTQFAKDLAHAQGWYEERRRVQVAFIAGISVVFSIATAGGMWWLRAHLKRLRLALVGMAFLLTFVVVRAASFHDVDVLLYRATGPFKLNWLFELGGIACIAINAWSEAREVRQARMRVRIATKQGHRLA